MQWLSDEAYCELTGLTMDELDTLVETSKLNIVVQDGVRMINPSSVVVAQAPYDKKMFETIMSLHGKLLASKDETLDAIRVENDLLKEALKLLQELYDEDRNTISMLGKQLRASKDEEEFMKRKYELMWDKTIEEYLEK